MKKSIQKPSWKDLFFESCARLVDIKGFIDIDYPINFKANFNEMDIKSITQASFEYDAQKLGEDWKKVGLDLWKSMQSFNKNAIKTA